MACCNRASGDSPEAESLPGDFNWFELYGKEPKAATAFYASVFHYHVKPDTRTERKNDYLLLSGELPRGGVAPLPEGQDTTPGWLGVVRVANMAEALQRVTALGGEILVAPRDAAYGSRFAIIADSTGGTVGLVEYVDNASLPTSP